LENTKWGIASTRGRGRTVTLINWPHSIDGALRAIEENWLTVFLFWGFADLLNAPVKNKNKRNVGWNSR
jgi:hypothetical protein